MQAESLAYSMMRLVAELGAETGWAATAAGPLRYAVRGKAGAPELLVLHGLGDGIFGWARVVGPLARTHRVHLLDLPGHGLSGAPPDWTLRTFLDAVASYAARLREPLLVGHSLGGWLAARLAISGAVKPRALVLVNPAGAVLPAEEWQAFRSVVSATDARGARAYLDRAFHRAPIALRLLPGEVLKAMRAAPMEGMLQALAAGDFLAAAEVASLRMPVRLIWGKQDRLLPAGTLAFFREALPDAEVIELERAGHCPHLERPGALAAAIAAPFR